MSFKLLMESKKNEIFFTDKIKNNNFILYLPQKNYKLLLILKNLIKPIYFL